MKPYMYALAVGIALVFFACGGGQTIKPTSEAKANGMKELQKGTGWYQKGCYHNALGNFMRAGELFAVSDYLAGTAMSMNNIGNVYRFIGDTQSALLFFDESYAIFWELNQYEGAIQALANKAAVLIQDSRIEEAEAVIQKAESLVASSGGISISLLSNKGILLTKKKDFAAAETLFVRSLKAIGSDNLRLTATVNASYGNLKMETGEYDQAIDLFNKALEADRASNFYMGMADDLTAIGTAYYLQEKYDPALNYLQRGIKIHAIFGNQEKISSIHRMMEDAAEKTGADLSITNYFVDKWASGGSVAPPCQ